MSSDWRERLEATAPPKLQRKGIRHMSYERIPEECDFGTYIGLLFRGDLENFLRKKVQERAEGKKDPPQGEDES